MSGVDGSHNGNGGGNDGNGNGRGDRERVADAITEREAAQDDGRPGGASGLAPRHPEDDPETLIKLARALEDPKENRDLASRAGLTTARIPSEEVFGADGRSGPLGRALDGDTAIRSGAEEIQSLLGSVPDQELRVAVEPDVVEIIENGKGDAEAARRVPGTRAERVAARAEKEQEIREVETRLADANEVVAKERDDDVRIAQTRRSQAVDGPGPAADGVPEFVPGARPARGKRPSLLVKTLMSRRLMGVFGVFDILLVAFLLQGSVTQALNTPPFASFAVAGGVSLGIQVGGVIGGYMLAGARLPIRMVTGGLSVTFVVLAVLLLGATEILREDPADKGGLAVFMWTTALAAYAAYCLSYAFFVHADGHEERVEAARAEALAQKDHEIVLRAGSPLEDALDVRDRLVALREQLVAELEEITRQLVNLDARQEELLDSAARTDARAADRIGQAARATERLKIGSRILEVIKSQEVASSAKGLELARLMHRKANVEEVGGALAVVGAEDAGPSAYAGLAGGLHRRTLVAVVLAIVALAIGGLGLLLSSPAVLAVGVAVAALALLALFLLRSGRRAGPGESVEAGDKGGISPTADLENRIWIRQPDHTYSATTPGDDQYIERA